MECGGLGANGKMSDCWVVGGNESGAAGWERIFSCVRYAGHVLRLAPAMPWLIQDFGAVRDHAVGEPHHERQCPFNTTAAYWAKYAYSPLTSMAGVKMDTRDKRVVPFSADLTVQMISTVPVE